MENFNKLIGTSALNLEEYLKIPSFNQKNFFIKSLQLLIFLLTFSFVSFGQISQVGTSTSAGTAGTSITINKPTGVVAGNIMIATFAEYTATATNTTAYNPSLAGWTLIDGKILGAALARRGIVLYRVADGTEGASFTFTQTTAASYIAGQITAFTGVNTTTPFDVTPGLITASAGTASAALSVPGITTVTNNSAIVLCGLESYWGRTWSAWSTTSPGALTEVVDYAYSGFASVGLSWALKATAGATGNGVATLSGTSGWGGIMLALRPAASPTITSISPLSGCPGTQITITGTNLTGAIAANVKVGGTAVSSIVSNNGTSLVVTVGAGTTGTVSVTTSAVATSSQTFTVLAAPVAPTANAATSITTTSALSSWSATAGSTSYRLDVSTSPTFATFLPGFNDLNVGNVTSYSITGLTVGTTYYYRVRGNNGSCSGGSSGMITFFTGWCTPTGSTTYYISNFNTSGGATNIANTTTASAGGYGNYTAQSCSQYANSPITFNITETGSTSYYYVWIDWNNDLDFLDAGETVVASTAAYTASYSGSYTVPAGTPSANYRMRVANSAVGVQTSCGPNSWGEYEDYTFSVVTPPVPTITSFTPATACGSGVPVVITGTNLTGATSVNINGVAVASYNVNSATQITAVTSASNTSGTISVVTGGGTATSGSTLSIYALPVISTQPVSPAAFCGGTGSATVSVTASGATSYAWYKNGVAISGSPYSGFTTNTLTITNPTTAENAAAITCVVTGTGSCTVTSSAATISVGTNPSTPTSVTATNSTICSGQSSQLNATTTAGNSIRWYDAATNGTILTTVPSATNYSVSPTATTTYYAESVTLNPGSTPTTVTFNYTGSIVNWTVPAGVTSINVDARGAQGGSQPEVGINWGGRGARIVGNNISVTPGQVLKILVGQAGTNGNSDDGCGGGGGSFVTTSANVPLVIAGGGAGDGADQQGLAASLTTTSTANGDASVAGSVAPNGGGANDGSGGGGLTGNGSNGLTTTSGGLSFSNGGAGGVGLRNGGFGGGGAGGTSTEGAGGGGGYAGGPGGSSGTDAGGGGSSYCSVTPATATATQTGSGQILITYNIPVAGCTSAARQAVTVTYGSPVITAQPSAPAQICGGAGTTTTSVTATGAVSYQWMKNGIAITGAPYSGFNTSTLTITNPTVAENAAALTCVVSGAGGVCSVTSSSVSLIVGNTPSTPTAVTATNSTICAGETSQLNATSAGNYINWYDAATGGNLLTTTPSATNYGVTPSINTTYYAEGVVANPGTTPVTQTFNYSGSIVNWTVPAGVTSINVDAKGAQGGAQPEAGINWGGRGARIVGNNISVTPGQVLKILVGQAGTNGNSDDGCGGGGGSFVTTSTNVPLVIAGGGAGDGADQQGLAASLTTTSTANGDASVAGSVAPNGGGANDGSGGGGLTGNGSNGLTTTSGGLSFSNGGAGGVGLRNGGFGGGGAGGTSTEGAGGGGGYAGGPGGSSGTDAGGGGSSYCIVTPATSTATQTGNGQIVITYTPVVTGCASAARQSVAVTVNNTPATPSAIVGALNPETGASVTYSVTNVAGISYAWAFPSTWTITAGQGTNSVTVTVGSVNGTISVTPSNGGFCPGIASTATTVIPQYRWKYVSANLGSSSWCPGETRAVSINIKNTGTASWTDVAATADFNVGIKWNTNGTSWADYYVRCDAQNLASGATATYSFTITAADATVGPVYGANFTGGTNNLTFDLVKEGGFWFANNTGGAGPGNVVYTSPSITINAGALPATPTVSVTGSSTVNLGATASLTSTTTGGTISWYTSPGVILGTGTTFTTPASCASGAITYYAIESGACTSNPGSSVITVNPLIASTPSNGIICNTGGSVTLNSNVTGGSAFSWSPATGLSSTNTAVTVASPTTTTQYTLSCTVTGCGSVSQTFNVGVIAGTAFTPTALPTEVCQGFPSTLSSNLASSGFTSASIPVSMSTAASPVVLCNACSVDDGSWNNVPIPFTYNFFGNNYLAVNIGSNGVLQFGASTGLAQYTYNSGNFPNAAYPENIIAAAAVDLRFTAGSISYWTNGIAPTRQFVVEYLNAAGYTGGSNSVQVKLFETTGIVEVHVANSSAYGTSSNRVVGLQDLTKTIGATAYSSTATITNQAWRFIPGANYTFQWSNVSGPISGATATTYSTGNLNTVGANVYSVSALNPTTQCASSQSVSVTVNATPAVPVSSGDVTNCSNITPQTLTATPPAGAVVDWYNGAGTLLLAGSNTYSVSVAGTYYAKSRNTTTGCTSASIAIQYIQTPAPAAPTVSNPAAYCQNALANALTATATGANTLNWYTAAPSAPSYAGATGVASAPTPSTAVAGTTNYYVSQTSSTNGCQSQVATIMVTVNATPSAPTASNPLPYCQNAPSSALTATATGGGTLYWYTDPTTNAGQTTTAPTPSTATAGTTNYYVSERNASGCESARTTITVTVTPSITASVTNSASSTSACGGGSITFTATPTNGGTPAYQWYLNGAPQSGETAVTYTLATPADANQIYVAMTPSAQTCLTSASATNSNTVTLSSTASTPTVSIQSSTATTVCTGTNVTFSVLSSANMGATPTYQWLLNGSPIVGATSSTYATTGLVNNNVISLQMTSSLSPACLTSSTATSAGITYTINPATAITTSPVSAAVCAGGSQNFSVVATGTGTLTYQWKKNGVNITGNATALTNQLTLSSVGAGDVASYTVVVTGTCSSATSAAASLTLNTATSIGTQPVAVTQCATTTAVFTVVASGQGTLAYQWRKDGSPLAGETAATLSIANISLANAGNYSVVVTGTCGAVTSSNASLTVNPATTISSQPVGSTICASNTANFSVTASGQGTLTYQWQLNGSPISGATSSTLTVTNAQSANAGSYSVIVTGACGSVTSNAAVLVVNPSTAITTQPAPVSACLNGNATFTVVATGTGTLTYQWKKDGVNVTGNASATTSTLTLTGLTAADAAIYSVVVSGGTCGVSSVTSNLASILTVNALPTVTANVTTTPVCLGSTTTLTGGGASTYSWNNGASNAVSFAPAATTTYTVTGTSAAGCTNTASVLVTVNTPTITATAAAGTVVWNGATSVDFGTSSNWLAYNGTSYAVSASAPTASTNVIIPVTQGCVAQQPSVVLSGTVAANDVVIESGATLSMGSGVLNIHGNYTNNGTLVGGTGTVAFVGASGNQSITKTGGETFTSMTVNKASGNVVLNNNVTVTGGLTLTNGLVVLGANNLTLGSATLTGGSSSSYVKTASSGVLKRNVGGTATTFPIGNGTYNPATLTNTGTADVFSLRLIDNVTSNGTGVGATTTEAVVNRTWMLEEATIGGSNVTLRLQWNGAGEQINTFSPASAFIAHYIAGASMWDNIGGTVGADYVESAGITSFSPFTISSSPTFAPLPVELLSLDAQCAGENVIVSWKTASEHNSLNFIVERSENGTSWSEIQTVGAAGNSNTIIEYAIEDAGAARGVKYYRLIQTDQDGAQKVYGPVMSNCGSDDNMFMSFPNPSDAEITLVFNDNTFTGPSTLTVRDAHGRVVRSMALEIQPGTTSILIPDMELEPAVYYLQLVGDNFTSPVIKHSLR